MWQPKNKRRKQKSTQAIYQQLEARQVMASLASALPIATNLIVNSGFERANNPNEQSLFADSDVDGFTAAAADEGQLLNIISFGVGEDATNVLDLDSTASQFDAVFQDITTRASDRLILSFEFRARTVIDDSAAPTTNQLEVFWDGVSHGVYSGVERWQTAALIVEGSDDVSRLEFREISEGSDGRGPIIDNVSLVLITDVAVENSGFENTPDSDSSIFAASNFLGWGAFATDVEDRLIRIESDDALDGDNFLMLDVGTQNLDRVFQDVSTTAGQQVFVSFDLRGIESESDANELRVRWDNQWVGTFRGDSQWQSFGLFLDASEDSDFSRLVFRQAASEDGSLLTGEGVQLDNIQVTVVDDFEQFAGLRALAEVEPEQRNEIYDAAPELTIDTDLTYRATIELEGSDSIDLLLFDDLTPNTVNNFVNLVEDGFYDGLFFNRVVNDGAGEPFVAQAGGPFTDSTAGGPGYTFENEIVDGLTFNRRGLLAMANSGGTNTNGSQFFITFGEPSFLDGNFTIFGEIELNDTESFAALDNLTFRDPTVPADLAIAPSVIQSIQISTES